MSVSENQTGFVATDGQRISLSAMFQITPGATDPAYLVLTGLDRNEYTVGATGATGSLSGNGATDALATLSGYGDFRTAGIIFTYNASTGQYVNATYGNLSQLTYTASSSSNDLTTLSLYGFTSPNAMIGSIFSTNPDALMQFDAAGYLGSVAIATQPGSAADPAQATPDAIASVAASFVGDAWNLNGCWVLASTIAAEAGAALPVTSTAIGAPGAANGEWKVAFNGPAGASGNWESMVRKGDIVVIGNDSGLGHIATCVSGIGMSAELVDNVTYVNAAGQIVDAADDGSADDVLIAPPHLASQEFSDALAKDVVIYRLDTPAVTTTAAPISGVAGATVNLGSAFAATDPFGQKITAYQVYDASTTGKLAVAGLAIGANSATNADTLASLAQLSLAATSMSGQNVIEVRASNGAYWGDWTSLDVTVSAAAAPALAKQTAAQTWTQGQKIAFALPGGTFTDPQGEKLTYTATQANGSALPGWLAFNTTTAVFTGTVPAGMAALSLKVTATNTAGISSSEIFASTIPAAKPILAHQTAAQTWVAGHAPTLTLATNTFTDPQGEKLTYSATLANGAALPGGLTLDAATGAFGGTTPQAAAGLSIKVTATDTSGLAASETIAVQVTVPPPVVAKQIAAQTWAAGKPVSLVIPTGSFTDPLGEKLTFAASLTSGAALPAGLTFNAATGTFGGTAPAKPQTLSLKITATDTSGMSATDSFSATIAAGAPTISAAIGNQLWTDGKAMSFITPSTAFTDPQGSTLTYAAFEVGGTNETSWLHFNPTAHDFFGTPPAGASGTIGVELVATNAYGLSNNATFGVTFAPGSSHVVAAPYTGTHTAMLAIQG